jgi:hypothetical protein
MEWLLWTKVLVLQLECGLGIVKTAVFTGFWGQESSQAEFLTFPPLGVILPAIQFLSRVPWNATVRTHHRRDEQSNADGNLTGQI